MTTFFSSDYHINHARIIEYSRRPFKDVEEMNREIIARHNSVVKAKDVVYNLGDFAFNEKYIPDILKQLNGEQHLVAGNHDKVHSCHKKNKKSIGKYLSYGFKSVQERKEIQIGEHQVLLSHLPYLKEEDKDQRYSQWRPVNEGKFLLCGHVHEKWKVNGRMINCGVDQWGFYPVSETEISELIADILEGEQI